MNITEFAIGNYVLLNGAPERVRGIQEDQFEPRRDVLLLGQGKAPLWYTLKEIEPIKLTDDLLPFFNSAFSIFDVDFLHQIQNLHLLTIGSELQIDYDKLKAAI